MAARMFNRIALDVRTPNAPRHDGELVFKSCRLTGLWNEGDQGRGITEFLRRLSAVWR